MVGNGRCELISPVRAMGVALGCLALVATFSGAAFADSITFSFFGGKSTPSVKINTSGVSLGPATLLAVSDVSTGSSVFFLPGRANISKGTASSYTAAGKVLVAQFNPGSGVEVQANSAACVGGSQPDVCLQGTVNTTGTSM